VEREFVYSFHTTYDGELYPDIQELDGGRFWTIAEIRDQIGKDIFTPNFEGEFLKIEKLLNL